ncbi:hypothetical protein SB768_33630, partial [Burkholderia sp. SIMBA_043]|uniref:hypothetical protein n=1 Tax=Burkholderia sp. SIMBA_043 TaxID=3085784 RepID=UPI00397D54BE
DHSFEIISQLVNARKIGINLGGLRMFEPRIFRHHLIDEHTIFWGNLRQCANLLSLDGAPEPLD